MNTNTEIYLKEWDDLMYKIQDIIGHSRESFNFHVVLIRLGFPQAIKTLPEEKQKQIFPLWERINEILEFSDLWSDEDLGLDGGATYTWG